MTKVKTSTLGEKAVLASLTISRWGARKLDKKVTDEVHKRHHAEADAGRYMKRLVKRDDVAVLNAVANSARNYHYDRTLPWLDDGQRILPSALFPTYASDMRKFRHDFEDAVDKFCDGYPAVVRDAKRRLNGLFNARDYPAPERIRSRFDFETRIFPCPDAGDFRLAIPDDQRADIERDCSAAMERALRGTVTDTAERITDVVGRMAERLKAYIPPKGKRASEQVAENPFRDSLVENVAELAALLPAFNMAGDKKLGALIARIERNLCDADANTLRSDDRKRKAVAKEAAAIVAAVSDFLA